MTRALLLCLTAALSGCATMIDSHKPAPKDWPLLTVRERIVPGYEVISRCTKYTPWWAWPPIACAEIRFDLMTCDIWRPYDSTKDVIDHEYDHCAGKDHHGDSTLADAWKLYKASVAGNAVMKVAR